jgi:bifunctional DNase/RNase
MVDEPVREIEMVVESVRVHMLSSRHVVILKDSEHDRYLPIWIGPWEASAIAMRLQGLTPERPLTHDLFATVLGNLGARIERVLISSLADETFHARLVLVQPDARHEVDARPSDAIALAVRLGVPIFAAEAVLEQAALGADAAEGGDEGEGAEGSPGRLAAALEATGEKIDPTRLDIFREFVNSLDQEGDQRGGAGPSS